MGTYGYRESFHLKTLSIGILLTLFVYYLAIVFHWDEIVSTITNRRSFLIWAAIGGFLPSLLKGGLVFKIYKSQKSLSKAIRAILLISFYLIGLLASVGAIIAIVTWLSTIISKTYWQRTHWFWVSVVLFLLFGYGYLLLRNFGFIKWQILQDLKTLPVVSPIFCFGGPYFWSQNLSYASLDPKLIAIYSTLTIFSGILFLFYLIVYTILNQKFEKPENNKHKIYISDDTTLDVKTLDEQKATNVCLLIFSIGLYIFLGVILDILTVLITK